MPQALDDTTPDATDVLDTGEAGRRVVAGSALRVVAFAAGSLLSVASIAFVARHLGTKEFDEYATVMSLTAIALLVTDFGIATLGVREYVGRTGTDRDHVMRVLAATRVLLMVVGTLGMLAFGALAGFEDQMLLGTALAGVGLIVYALPSTYVIPLQATLRLGWVGAIDLVRQATQTAVLIALAVLGSGVALMLGALIPAVLASLVVAAFAARGLAPLVPAWDWREMSRLLRLSASFAVATSIGSIYAYVAQIVTHLSTSEYESGQFALSFRVFSVVVATAMIAVSGAYPVLVRSADGDKGRFAHAGRRLYEATLLLGIAAALGMAIGAPAILQILGGDEYAEAVDIARLHGVAVVGSFLVASGSFLLLSVRAHRALFVINVCVLAVSITLTALMASRWGGAGAAVAMCITEFSLAIAFYVTLQRLGHGVRLSIRRIGTLSAAAGIAVAVAVGLTTLDNGWGVNVLVTAAAVLVFCGAALVGGGVPIEVTRLAKDRLRRS